jgi:hypothetical protein
MSVGAGNSHCLHQGCHLVSECQVVPLFELKAALVRALEGEMLI